MTVIVQQFSPQSLRITIQIPMGKWNRFRGVLGSLCDPYRGRLVGASEVAAREPRSPSSAILPSGAVLKRHTELMRYTRNVLASEGWGGGDCHNHFQLAKSKKALEQ